MKSYQNPDFQIIDFSRSDVLTGSVFRAEEEGVGDSIGIDSLTFQ